MKDDDEATVELAHQIKMLQVTVKELTDILDEQTNALLSLTGALDRNTKALDS